MILVERLKFFSQFPRWLRWYWPTQSGGGVAVGRHRLGSRGLVVAAASLTQNRNSAPHFAILNQKLDSFAFILARFTGNYYYERIFR